MRGVPANRFTLRDLTEFWNLSYSGYFVPISFTEEMLSDWMIRGALDLDLSPVLMDGDTFVGISLLGIRGSRGWIGGFGISPLYRGRGLANSLFSEQIGWARANKLPHVQLEVLSQNWAQKVYARAGFNPTRSLAVLAGLPSDASAPSVYVHAGEPELLLRHHGRLHKQFQACWQREVPYLTALPDPIPVHGSYTGQRDWPSGYLLYTHDATTIRILDGAVQHTVEAKALVCSLALQYPDVRIICINEPLDSPLYTALRDAGVALRDTQIEMHWGA